MTRVGLHRCRAAPGCARRAPRWPPESSARSPERACPCRAPAAPSAPFDGVDEQPRTIDLRRRRARGATRRRWRRRRAPLRSTRRSRLLRFTSARSGRWTSTLGPDMGNRGATSSNACFQSFAPSSPRRKVRSWDARVRKWDVQSPIMTRALLALLATLVLAFGAAAQTAFMGRGAAASSVDGWVVPEVDLFGSCRLQLLS